MNSANHTSASVPSLPDGITDDSVSMIGRQAILNERREVFGYELFDRSTAVHAHTAASDAAMLFNALSYAETEALLGRKLVFINCTHESLAGGHLELIHPDKVVLEISTLEDNATPTAIAACIPIFEGLRQRGFRLAFDQNLLRRAYVNWLPMASFIKLDMLTFPIENAEALVKFARTHTIAQIVAEKVETQAQFEHMLGLGVKLFKAFGLQNLTWCKPRWCVPRKPPSCNCSIWFAAKALRPRLKNCSKKTPHCLSICCASLILPGLACRAKSRPSAMP